MTWLPKKSVVVPVDFSNSSLEAVQTALEFVESPSNVHIVYVTQPLHVAEPGMLWGSITDDERMKSATKALAERLQKEEMSGVTTKVMLGAPAHMISDYAEETKADLIVIPSHGRSGVTRFFLGSVTEKVLRMANCQVLVLRASDDT
ncbi:MAG: universal stress protein [Myxococcales bacterium]|nr:universal stress protein [Myxococcales bacterium]